MNIALWIVQGLIAIIFLMTGLMKLTQPKQVIVEKGMKALEPIEAKLIKLLGLVEVLGAIGLILPKLTGILPWLTPLSGIGLIIVMGGAISSHIKLKESIVPNLIIGLMAAFVIIGRVLI